MLFDAAAIARATQGQVVRPGGKGRLCTDTRAIEAGDWFVALVGVRFDGHAFVTKAIEAGAQGVIVSEVPKGLPAEVGVVLVDDTTRAFQRLGTAARHRLKGPVVALTGSSGKTTTRALVSLALSPLGAIHQTVGNLNNHLGVPMTLVAGPEDAAATVVEMGTSAPGEISFLARLGEPDVRIVINVGPAHLEELGGLPGVAVEKSSLVATGRPGDIAVVNGDDPYLKDLVPPEGMTRLRWGRSEGVDLRLVDVQLHPEDLSTSATYATPEGEVSFRIPLPGEHIAHNAGAALCAALALGVPMVDAARAMEGVKPVGMRMRSEPLAGGGYGLNDAYNANPASMKASLSVLAQLPGTRIAVMGDMLELGPHEAEFHREVVAYADTLGLAAIVLVGPRATAAASAATQTPVHAAADHADAARFVQSRLTPDAVVLFKGSRGAKVEAVLEPLRAEVSP